LLSPIANTHEFHPKLKTRNRQLSRYMKLVRLYSVQL
jgi:hypothetical protein